MPREIITVQVGQCGNQIGSRFWDLLLREHAEASKSDRFDESMGTFFRNVDAQGGVVPLDDGKQPISHLRARAVLVDMEEGVLSEIARGPLSDLFDETHFLSDVSGSGNNWAYGNRVYGPRYHEALSDVLHRTAEQCDSLQSFFLMHSLGGGTGSGLGTYLLSLLEDEFPDVYRFSTVVFPSEDDDVVTSPYNSILSLRELIRHTDCVLPVENQMLFDICSRLLPPKSDGKAPFSEMNGIVGRLLSDLTSSMRFEGSLNVDLNEITMNLVPFPRLHFLIPGLSPLQTAVGSKNPPRRLDQIFSESFSPECLLMKCQPKLSKYLACGLIVRGNAEISDISRNLERIRPSLNMVEWNDEAFKIGHCSVPPLQSEMGVLCLQNSCCFREVLQRLIDRFHKLFKRKAHLHHYTELIDVESISGAAGEVKDLIFEYASLEEDLVGESSSLADERMHPCPIPLL